MGAPYGIAIAAKDEYDAGDDPFRSGSSGPLARLRKAGGKFPRTPKNPGVRVYDRINTGKGSGFHASETGSGDPHFSTKG